MSGEKTEQPTDKKRRDSREKGQVAQSKDLTMFSAIFTIVGAICLTWNKMLVSYFQSYTLILSLIQDNRLSLVEMSQVLSQLCSNLLTFLVPIFIAAAISFVINLVQLKGLILSKEFMQIKFDKLNPMSNFKSTFSKKNLIKFIKNLCEIIVMGITAFLYAKANLNDIVKLSLTTVSGAALYMTTLTLKIFCILLALYLVFGLIDFISEAMSLTKQLMMSKEDLKQEYKNSEGDPEVKHKRKEFHHELLEGEPVKRSLESSTLILANPTHIAIVILYRPRQWKVPIVLAKARDKNAMLIFEYAKQLKIPIIQDKWLARKLYVSAETGKYIPRSLGTFFAQMLGKNMNLLPKLAQELQEIKLEQSKAAGTKTKI